jgi:hypothetical protein
LPNWVDQDLFVIGPPSDLERFCERGVTGTFGRARKSWRDEPTFRFDRACPLCGTEKRLDEHRSAILYRYVRSHTEAYFQLQTSWSYPEHFYLTRLTRDWPTLQFCCAVNEDMGNFGGVVAGIDGNITDLVSAPNDVRAQRKLVRQLMREWRRVASRDRPWMVQLPLRYIQRVQYGVDAVFEDEYANVLYLKSERDVRRLVRGRKSAVVYGRGARGKWIKAPGLCKR